MSAQTNPTEQNAPGTVSPDSSATGQNSADPAATGTPGNPDDLAATVSRLAKQVEDQSRVIGRLQGDMKKAASPATHATEPDHKKAGGNPEYDAIRQELAQLTEERKRLSSAARRTHVSTSLLSGGVDQALVEMATDSIIARYGDRLHVETDAIGGYSTVYRESEDADPVSVADWTKQWLATPAGQRLIPARRAPGNIDGTGGDPAGKRGITRDELSTVSTKDLLSGKFYVKD